MVFTQQSKKLRWTMAFGVCLVTLAVYLSWLSSVLTPTLNSTQVLSPTTEQGPLAALASSVDHQVFRTLEWKDLMPDSDLQAILNAPAITHEGEEEYYNLPMQGLSPDGFELDEKAAVDDATRAFQEALVSSKIRPELDGEKIRVPGFMVPIEMDGPKNVTEFFLVPYFGACIHEPPPPPNQIIHVEHPQGYYLDDLFTPVWVVGTAHTTNSTTSGVNAAYAMSEVRISLYSDPPGAGK